VNGKHVETKLLAGHADRTGYVEHVVDLEILLEGMEPDPAFRQSHLARHFDNLFDVILVNLRKLVVCGIDQFEDTGAGLRWTE